MTACEAFGGAAVLVGPIRGQILPFSPSGGCAAATGLFTFCYRRHTSLVSAQRTVYVMFTILQYDAIQHAEPRSDTALIDVLSLRPH